MSFIGYMICIVIALFFGMILDRLIIKTREDMEVYEYACVSFKEKKSAEMVLQSLNDILNNNGVIRVYDYYTLCGTGNITLNDFKFGWKDTNGFSIDNGDGCYVLNVPEPCQLEK